MAEQPGVQPSKPLNFPIELSIPPDFRELEVHLEHLRSALTSARIAEDLGNQAVFVAEELLTNALKYGGVTNESLPMRVIVSTDDKSLLLNFSTRGDAFDPRCDVDHDREESLADRPIGGLGLLLVNRLASQIDYRFENGWNHVTVALSQAGPTDPEPHTQK